MSNTIPFTEEDIKKYIDDTIQFWRAERDGADYIEHINEAAIYVDAFQSVRISLFGEYLSENVDE